MSVIHKLYGSAIIAAHVKGQRLFPFRSRDELDSIRDQRIRRMVMHAAKDVPYYRDLFKQQGIDPKQIRNAEGLDRLPILEKETVRSKPQMFIAEGSASRGAISFQTSGSSGTPMQVFHDRYSLLTNIAFGERERASIIKLCGGLFRPKEVYVGYDTSTFKNVITFYEQNVLFPVRPRRRIVSLLEPVDQIASIVNSERPDILTGYGGWIDLFFKTVAALNIDLHRPKMALYMGEALPHGARSFIENEFGIPVMSRYNAVEAFKIGFFCEERKGFHLHEDLTHVRIVRPDGKTAAPGEQGAVTLSNLVNKASVLLNYRIGDVASMRSGSCPCGRNFQLLSELEGRVEDILLLADGRHVHPRAVWQIFKDNVDVLQYQLTQQELQRFELHLVTNDMSSFQRAVQNVTAPLKQLLGPETSIEMTHRSNFPRDTGAKFRAVVAMKNNHSQRQSTGI